MVVNPAKMATTTPTSERAISAHTLISIVATHIPIDLLSIFFVLFLKFFANLSVSFLELLLQVLNLSKDVIGLCLQFNKVHSINFKVNLLNYCQIQLPCHPIINPIIYRHRRLVAPSNVVSTINGQITLSNFFAL